MTLATAARGPKGRLGCRTWRCIPRKDSGQGFQPQLSAWVSPVPGRHCPRPSEAPLWQWTRPCQRPSLQIGTPWERHSSERLQDDFEQGVCRTDGKGLPASEI